MDDYSGLRNQIQMMGLTKPDAYNPYAAGAKVYGPEARSNPTSGPVSQQGQQGYNKRDMEIAARKQAILERLLGANKQMEQYRGGAM